MSTGDDETFLNRWSRRKRATAAAEPAPAAPPEHTPRKEPPVDLDALPSIDSLGRDSDYTQFLREGVPDALRNQALRKAWSTDPAITGFKTFADYDWDCNAPGYGALWPGDDAKAMTAALFRHLTAPEDDAPENDPTEDDGTAPTA